MKGAKGRRMAYGSYAARRGVAGWVGVSVVGTMLEERRPRNVGLETVGVTGERGGDDDSGVAVFIGGGDRGARRREISD